jgi:glycosyltransferase involved in cell wall biosynthesis
MSAFPLFSIITVTYQAETTLPVTVDRFLEQEVTDYEYIFVDGGSTDGTVELIRNAVTRFAEKGISARWISERDNGLYDAMNKGLSMANGIYVWFMNAGDCLAGPCTLSNLVSFLDSGNPALYPDFLYGETLIVDEHYNVLGPRRLKAPAVLTWRKFKWGMLVCHQSMIVRRSIAQPFNTHYKYSADFDWAIRCMKASSFISNSGLVLAYFQTGGLTNKRMKASLKERFTIMVENYGWVSTIFLHAWFVVRAAWFKLFHGWF